MAKRQLTLTEQEIEQLRHAEGQTKDVRELRHYQAIRLYGTGVALPVIMDLVNAGESTIRQWAMAYQAQGIAGLRIKWQGNNANKLSQEQRTLLRERLQTTSPAQLQVSTRQFWTVQDLRVVVREWFGVEYQDAGSYCNLFHASGFSYQRASKVYRHRPSEAQVAAFEAELEKK